MAAEVEEVVDPVVDGKETLRLAGWLEALYLPLPLSRRLVRVLGFGERRKGKPM